MRQPHQIARAKTRILAGVLLTGFIAFVYLCAGCSTASPTPTDITSAASTVGSTSPNPDSGASATATSGSTTTAPSLLSSNEKELARTAKVEHAYAVYLDSEHVPENDPRMAVFFGLRARVQALTCLGAIKSQNLQVADQAMLDVYRSLNRAQAIATGNIAETLSEARSAVASVGAPSDHPDEAAKQLERFVEKLSSLVDEATKVLATTTTTAG